MNYWKVTRSALGIVITCRGHDSHFKASDGSRIDGVAPTGLRPVQVQVKEGYVVKIAG